MRQVQLIGLLFTVLVISSCKKEKIEIPESNEPVFRLEGTLGSESIQLIAGDNEAYMFTGTQWVNGVQLFTGTMDDGNTSVELGIYDGWIDMQSSDLMAGLSGLSIPFAKTIGSPLVVLNKQSFSNQSFINSINWFANDQFIGTNYATITAPGRYNVCAHVIYTNGDSATLCNDVLVGYKRSANSAIYYTIDGGSFDLHAELSSQGAAPSSVIWYFNGSQIGSGTTLAYNTGGISGELQAEINYPNGVKRTKKCHIGDSGPVNSLGDFTIFEENSNNVHEQDFNLSIRVNHEGKSYESVAADNESSVVTINNISYFGKNSNGKDVYKFDVNVDSKLRSLSSNKQVSFTFNAVFGIEVQ